MPKNYLIRFESEEDYTRVQLLAKAKGTNMNRYCLDALNAYTGASRDQLEKLKAMIDDALKATTYPSQAGRHETKKHTG